MTTPGGTFDEYEREREAEEADRLRKKEPAPQLTNDEFLAWRSPKKKATGNPTRVDSPLWNWLVRTQWNAYRANELMGGPSSMRAGPMWTFDRYGQSKTLLANGHVVYIGGEHEDYYDPDFFIYNDVVILDETGKVSIYCYSEDDFPPTDFHSATLVGSTIFIIGCLGHSEQRDNRLTPVYQLSLDSMQIKGIESQGDSPGWIYKHSATLSDDGKTIVVSAGERWHGNDRTTSENIDSWTFDTSNCTWCRLTKLPWQRWTMRRADRQANRLWDTRQELWVRNHSRHGFASHWAHDREPNFTALAMLYRISEESPAPFECDKFGSYSVVVDGLVVRFKEDRFVVEAIVEGELGSQRLNMLKKSTLSRLEQIDNAPYVIDEYQVV